MPVADDLRFLPSKGQGARPWVLALLGVAPFAFGALALFLGQDANWDLRNYHWYNAYAFLNGRYGFDLFPSQTPYFYNPTLDVPFYLLATHASARTAAFVLGSVQGLNFILLFMLAHVSLNLSGPRVKSLAALGLATLGMLGGGGIAQIGTTFYDNVTSLGLFASALLVIRQSRTMFEGGWRRALVGAVLCGVPAGLAMGLKLPCVAFCVGLCGALLLAGGAWPRRVGMSFGFGVGVLLGCAVTLGHWALFLGTHFGNPLFPYFNELFQSPLAPPVSARDTQYIVHGWAELAAFPFAFADNPYRVGEIPWRDWRIPVLYALLPLALAARLLGRRLAWPGTDAVVGFSAARYLLAAAVISYGVWLRMFCIYRYLVPLEMLAPLLIAFAAGMLPLRGRYRVLLALLALAVAAGSVKPGDWYRRAGWEDRFVDEKIPPLGDTRHLMILMAGFEPYSHLVTRFPPEIPFVRLQSNLATPEEGKGVNALIRQRLDGHVGRFMILIPPWQHDLADGALRFFGLRADWRACQTLADHLYDDKPMDLCPVTRVHE